MEQISEDQIRNWLSADRELIVYEEIDSTNNAAKQWAQKGAPDGSAVVALRQTAGKGRLGRSFYSPSATGIYMTVILRPSLSLEQSTLVTSAAAVATARAIEKVTGISVQIKWVNDVYCGENKICGILTEAVSDFELGVVTSVIVGIGINIKTNSFPDDVKNAGALNADVKRADLIGAVADELLGIAFGDYSAFIDYYRSHSMILGKNINFIENGKVTPAKAVAIDETGGLVVKTADGVEKTLKSGEISIRW